MDRPHVIIIGAGVGGLCLAQGLSLSGVPVNVYERDASSTSSVAGYRLSISPTGNRALKSCLPDAVFDRLTIATGEPSRGVTFLDHRLNRLMAIDLPVHDRGSLDSERPIDRAALRRALLEGMEGVVRFNKTFVSYSQEPDGRVTALFSDGATATGDLIVGADGANSKVRAQLLPEATRIDTGLVAIGGKLPLNDSAPAVRSARAHAWADADPGSAGMLPVPESCLLSRRGDAFAETAAAEAAGPGRVPALGLLGASRPLRVGRALSEGRAGRSQDLGRVA